VAYFSGGWLFEKLGRNGLYGLPIALFVLQFALTGGIENRARHRPGPSRHAPAPAPHHPEAIAYRQSVPPRRFLQMAWLANPFAYVAINTVLAVVPQLADRFQLTPAQSGVFCSLWFYVRLAAFIVFWQWTGWHYRFRWLLLSYLGLTASFAVLLLSPKLWWVVGAQVVFGFAVGLTYYSSLFYAMDVGEEKGEHGGLHEAAIGLGSFAGPALSATTLTYLPQYPNSGAVAVSGLLLVGLAGLVWLRVRKA
jgi:MFS family permease